MEGFWIIGIVVNLVLTSLAIYWIVRQVRAGRPGHGEKGGPHKDTEERE